MLSMPRAGQSITSPCVTAGQLDRVLELSVVARLFARAFPAADPTQSALARRGRGTPNLMGPQPWFGARGCPYKTIK